MGDGEVFMAHTAKKLDRSISKYTVLFEFLRAK